MLIRQQVLPRLFQRPGQPLRLVHTQRLLLALRHLHHRLVAVAGRERERGDDAVGPRGDDRGEREVRAGGRVDAAHLEVVCAARARETYGGLTVVRAPRGVRPARPDPVVHAVVGVRRRKCERADSGQVCDDALQEGALGRCEGRGE